MVAICHVLWTATAAGEDMSDANNWHEGNFLQMVNGNIVLFGEGGSDNEVVWSAGRSNNGSKSLSFMSITLVFPAAVRST